MTHTLYTHIKHMAETHECMICYSEMPHDITFTNCCRKLMCKDCYNKDFELKGDDYLGVCPFCNRQNFETWKVDKNTSFSKEAVTDRLSNTYILMLYSESYSAKPRTCAICRERKECHLVYQTYACNLNTLSSHIMFTFANTKYQCDVCFPIFMNNPMKYRNIPIKNFNYNKYHNRMFRRKQRTLKFIRRHYSFDHSLALRLTYCKDRMFNDMASFMDF